MAKPKTAQVGDMVLYQGREGQELPALVLMTPATFDAEKNGFVTAPTETGLSLLVYRLSGRTYVRHNVPQDGSPDHKALADAKAVQDAENAAFDGIPDEGYDPFAEPGKPIVVRSWKFRA